MTRTGEIEKIIQQHATCQLEPRCVGIRAAAAALSKYFDGLLTINQWAAKSPTYDDLAQFVRCIAETFPPDIMRDHFGRITGPRSDSLRRHLANKHQIGGCVYADEQIGKIALSLLNDMKGD